VRQRTWFDQAIEELQDDVDFLTEEAALHLVSEIRRVMEEAGVTQAELARRIGKSRAYVSRVLNYNPNMTLRSLVVLAHALEAKWEPPRLVGKRSGARAGQRRRPPVRPLVEAVADEPMPAARRRRG
jgi:transcriptional regulator with XRE-family HTH domain